MNQFRSSGAFGNMPTVVKNLLIINGLFFLATVAAESQGIRLSRIFGAFYWDSQGFEPWQIVTHMFMHGGLAHLFFNMFALWMFGTAIERVWGPKRFLIYYMVTGLGAYFIHYGVIAWEANQLIAELGRDALETVKRDGLDLWMQNKNYVDPDLAQLNRLYNRPVVGASGAVFGILLAFGMMFPNTKLIMLFFPVPIKAKYFVIGYGLLELYSGIAGGSSGNVAHFAHLGGMIFGFILIKYWSSGYNNRQY